MRKGLVLVSSLPVRLQPRNARYRWVAFGYLRLLDLGTVRVAAKVCADTFELLEIFFEPVDAL